jgi:hypothetical protein
VNHCLRFYVRNPHARFHSVSDKHNWEACKDAFKGFDDTEKELLTYIYKSGDTVADNVYELSKERGIAQDRIWKLVNALERKVAKRRGLL